LSLGGAAVGIWRPFKRSPYSHGASHSGTLGSGFHPFPQTYTAYPYVFNYRHSRPLSHRYSPPKSIYGPCDILRNADILLSSKQAEYINIFCMYSIIGFYCADMPHLNPYTDLAIYRTTPRFLFRGIQFGDFILGWLIDDDLR
jgi:hypothetical protein